MLYAIWDVREWNFAWIVLAQIQRVSITQDNIQDVIFAYKPSKSNLYTPSPDEPNPLLQNVIYEDDLLKLENAILLDQLVTVSDGSFSKTYGLRFCSSSIWE